MRALRWSLAIVILLGACTSAGSTASPSTPTGTVTQPSTTPTPAGAVLADGTPLPAGCAKDATASQTVAFVSAGRAWALDPRTSALSCLFAVHDPGPFAWGPQGDRVLLGDLRVRGVATDAPNLPPIDAQATAFGWGHPNGLAVVYADGPGAPDKRFMDDGSVETLSTLPAGTYLQIVYHPSGLALAFVVEHAGKQAIWFSTNEGKDPERLVFGVHGTTFTSLAFSPDGQRLWWIAEHAQGYPQLHWMDLGDRTGFTDVWRGSNDTIAQGLEVSPGGRYQAMTQGADCAEHRALIVQGGAASSAMPFEDRPTTALGWLDRTHVLVAAGGCGAPTELFSADADGGQPVALVSGTELAAPRTVLRNAPDTVPAPNSSEGQPPLGGVG
jgi:hypothetical protein